MQMPVGLGMWETELSSGVFACGANESENQNHSLLETSCKRDCPKVDSIKKSAVLNSHILLDFPYICIALACGACVVLCCEYL